MKNVFFDDKADEDDSSPASSLYDVFNEMNFPVCILDIKGKLIAHNTEFNKLFKTKDESVSLDWSHPFFPEYRKRIATAYLRALKGQERRCFAIMQSSDGNKIPVEIYLFPMFKDQNVSKILVFLKVVDERIMSFDRSTVYLYEDSIGYDSNIYDFSPFPILKINRQGEVLKGSVSLEGLFGYSIEKMKEKRNILIKSISLYDFERIRKSVMSIFDGDVSFKRLGEIRIIVKQKEEKWVNITLYPISKNNNVAAVEIIFEDITLKKRLEKKLGTINRIQIVSDLAKGLIHSFSNIINVIMSRSQLLLQLTDKDVLVNGLKIIERTAIEGVKQIRRIQNFVLDGEKIQEQAEENFIELIEDAIEFANLQFKVEEKEKRRTIKIDRKYYTKVNIISHSRIIREIVISMIFKVTTFIKKEGTIHINLRDNGNLMLIVSTEIPESEIENEEDTPVPDLGYEIDIRRIAEQMNMKIIEEESQELYSIKAILPSAVINRIKKEEEDLSEIKLKDLDIIIVEDDKELQEILFEIFDHLGNRVTLFANGEETITAVKNKHYDILITDYGLSGITGLELAARVKELDEKIATVLLTGWTLSDINNISAYENVIDLFFQKPFKLETLIKGIAKVYNSQKQ